MGKLKKRRHLVIPVIFSVFYTIYLYIGLKFMVENNLFISNDSVTIQNIGIKFVGDFLIMLLVPSLMMIVFRERLKEFRLRFSNTYLEYILIGIIALLFIIHRDFTIRGYYNIFFYIVVVAFGEEFIFRGYVYNEMLKESRGLAIIISGLFFGILHSVLPGLMGGYGLGQISINMLSEIGGGIIGGYYFIYILEKSNSLFVPILVHTIINYSIGPIGLMTLSGVWIYLFFYCRNKSPVSL